MKTRLLVAALAAVLAAAVQPQDWAEFDAEWANSPEYETSKALCRQLRGHEPPAADRPTPAQARSLTDCSSEALYYGIGRAADPERARLCALTEAEAGADQPFAGRAMLMTIYANGVGARRDLDVAIHLACGLDGAPAESHGRVSHLAELRAQGWSGADFHYCDDITSGISGGICAEHRAQIEGGRRTAELARLLSGWTAAELEAFGPLQQAFEAYVEAHAEGEVDMSGTLRNALYIGAQEALRTEFLEMLRHLEGRTAPVASAAQFRAADADLNRAYREALRAVASEPDGTVTADGIRAAQRAWLRYRDAFVAFAAVKSPRLPRDSVAAWLTWRRTALLRGEE
ncbi:MAG: hypothetical protein QOI38_2904 [Sphingomonadales bacterium]|jgi:hypothetical protein|nr:hypothetical protein [Sphingomonadales bacterium]